MSRQNKNTKKIALRKQITAMHKSGGKGPAKTSPKHGKVMTAHKLKKMGKKVPVHRDMSE